MSEKEFLYSTVEGNKALKSTVAELNATVKFDKEAGAFELITDGLSAERIGELRVKLAPYLSEDAKAAWASDREQFLQSKAALKNAVLGREGTTREPKPEKTMDTYQVYPAPSQKSEYRRLIKETNSKSAYHKPTADVGAHFVVRTDQPEKFAAFMGEEAKDRFAREYQANGQNPQVDPEMEELREHVAQRGSRGFMAQYAERGFRLSDPTHSPDVHAKQLAQMRTATDGQLKYVLVASHQLRNPLIEKEARMRADVAGMSVEQLKALSWEDQKKVATVDGRPVGLVGPEFSLNSQLSKGIAAINKELEARGVAQSRSPERAQENQKAAEQQHDRAQANGLTKGPRGAAVDEGQSVDDSVASLQAAARARGRGR